MSLTTSQIINLARKKALENGTELLPDTDLLIYANFAYEDLIKKTRLNKHIKSASVSLVNGEGTLPSDYGTMYGDPYVSKYDVYPEIAINDFTRGGQGSTIEDGKIKVSNTALGSINIKYYPKWNALTLDVNPEIDGYFHELLVYGILERVYEDLQDEQMSKLYADKMTAKLEDKKSTMSQYEEDNQTGGVLFNGIAIIENEGTSLDPNRF